MDLLKLFAENKVPTVLVVLGAICVLSFFFNQIAGFAPRPETRKWLVGLGVALIATGTALGLREQPVAHIDANLSRMGDLAPGLAYLQADYRSALVHSAAECSALCASEARCMAMTFVISQNRCWLKESVPATAASSDMISAVKLGPHS